jgi:hypothetical protein
MEFYSEDLLGISAPTESQANALIELLSSRERLGHLTYEYGFEPGERK